MTLQLSNFPHDYVWPDDDLSVIPDWVYTDQAIYEREVERIFHGPTWNYVALEAEPSYSRGILRWDGGGSYAVLSADGDMQDGIRPSLLLRDEVHRWKTQRAETLYDVVTKGQISRSDNRWRLEMR